MDWRRLGFYVVCLSSVSSIIMYLAMYFVVTPALFQASYLTPTISQTVLNTLTIGFQVAGLALYSLGTKKSWWTPRAGFSTIMVVWGLLTIFIATFGYRQLLSWSERLGVRALTTWDHLEFATWGLKGCLWLFSGLLFLHAIIFAKATNCKT